MSTLKGQSGAPIVLEGEDKQLTIVGIHKGGVTTEILDEKIEGNVGRILSPCSSKNT